ncbi:unknown [Bacteroides sp. CAG:144]|nr:unknown [Bacteroides sp. CAG:144]
MQVDENVGIAQSHRRTFSETFIKKIGNSVFCPVSYELGMAELVGVNDRVDRKSHFGRQVLCPVHCFYLGVEFVGVSGCKGIDGFEYAQCGTAVQVGFVEKFLVAGKRDHSSACFYVFTAECGYFRSENLFESLERFSNECRCG